MGLDKKFWLCFAAVLLIPSSVNAVHRDHKDNKKAEQIEVVELKRNYPNPFETRTTIEYTLSDSANVFLTILDNKNKPIDTLVNEKQGPGIYKVEFDATDHSSGLHPYRMNTLGQKFEVYKYQLQTDHFFECKKMLRIVD